LLQRYKEKFRKQNLGST